MTTPKKQGKMVASIKKTWLTALRSGKYSQATGQLQVEEGPHTGFCCLGVLQCAVEGKVKSPEDGSFSHLKYGLTDDLQTALARANDGGPVVSSFKYIGYEAPVRDRGGRKSSFKAIANWIEKNL